MAFLLFAALVIPLGLDLYMPIPEANPLTEENIELGRRLFNDRRLSRDGTIACSSCHDPARVFSVNRDIAPGVSGRIGRRNAPTLVNRGYGRAFFWDGRAHSLEEQVLQPIQDPNEMDLTLAEAVVRTGVDATTISHALASYVRVILSGDSPYDRFVAGDRAALSADAQAGMQIFRGRGNCTACHIGPTFSDERPHNTGVAWRDGRLMDIGAGHGDFKTPTLREVARTSPYMHDGSLPTLDAVVDFYSDGGHQNPALDPEIRPLHLSASEKHAVLAFLQSLSGTVSDGQ
jgi:cytochrome c peroxidase